MATIVWHRKRETRYILLGGGFGAYKTAMPHPFLGNYRPVEDHGELAYALVSDEHGDIFWVDTTQLQVLSVDGVEPNALLGE